MHSKTNHLHRILKLVQKDFLLEWRQKYSLYGLLLYLTSATFIIYLLHELPDGETWNTFYWLILLFVCVNAVAKSFLQEGKDRFIYYYTINNPQDIILSKLIYNVILMIVISIATLLLFVLLLEFPTLYPWKFIGISILGGISLSLLFTMLSAIASKAGGNSALIAILGFPLVIPQLLLLSDISKPLFLTLQINGWWKLFLVLFVLDIMIVFLSILLFPFLWKE
jgi:heme exporter protein B